jgi:hypothetical protein
LFGGRWGGAQRQGAVQKGKKARRNFKNNFFTRIFLVVYPRLIFLKSQQKYFD